MAYSMMGRRMRPRTELTEKEVRKIKFQHLPPTDEGGDAWSVKRCAEVYNVCQETIRRIGRGETWAWITPDAIDLAFAQPAPEMTPEARAAFERMQASLGMASNSEGALEEEAPKLEQRKSDALFEQAMQSIMPKPKEGA